MHFNEKGLTAYPDAIRRLPFCAWRIEKRNGKVTKVPYDPRTNQRAHVDRLETFTDLKTALLSVPRYAGIGVRVAGNVGCVDVDHCIQEDGGLTDIAASVLPLFPDAFIEYSPSGTGLHIYFRIPLDFTFDSDDYYINNRKNGLEIYIPGSTNRFLTVTGNVFQDGDMTVSREALDEFLSTFMKRPALMPARIDPPEGGSVLSDAEVIHRASRSASGEKFMRLYRGEWEGEGWSHSEADMSLCRTLAFWCRGDMEQMDHIFRESGLMRDKWDRPQSGSTYGEITMQNAIKGCTAFYEPRASAEEDFSDEAEHDDAEHDNSERDDAAQNAADQIDLFLASEITIDVALSEPFLSAAAWAYQHDMARYVKLKGKIPREIGARNFEREVKSQMTAQKEAPTTTFLRLSGVSTPGMLVPEGWIVNDTGVYHIELVFGEQKPVRVSAEPLFISAKLVNVDDGTEKLEVTFRRNGHYKTLITPRADMLNKNAIIKYADEGFPVSSGTAGTMTKFIAEMEAVNLIPIRRSIRRAGWIGNEFFPYSLANAVAAQTDGNETERILAALTTSGSEEAWLDAAMKLRAMPFARAMLAASFASPLLEKLRHRVIYFHIWYGTRSGKTAALKLAMSVWGDPRVLVSKYFSTIVGMERWAGTLKHLPFAMDELQTLNEKRLSINDIVYTMGNGVGKTRGRVGAGLQKVEEWRNCILSTGEQPMSAENSMDGVNTRLLELYACPLSADGTGDADDALAQELHQISEQHYGFAGKRYVQYVVEHLDALQADYTRFQDTLASHISQKDSVAVLALADYYASLAVFGEGEDVAFQEAISLGRAILKNLDENEPRSTVDSSWDFVCGWIASNKAHFLRTGFLYDQSPVFGVIENDRVYVIGNVLNKALDEAGYSHRKCIKGFMEKGYIDSFADSEGKKRSQVGKSIKGILSRVYSLRLKVERQNDEDEDFLK